MGSGLTSESGCGTQARCSGGFYSEGQGCQDPCVKDSHQDDVLEAMVGGTLMTHWLEKARLERQIVEREGVSSSSLPTAALLEELGATCGILGMLDRQLQVLHQALILYEQKDNAGDRVARTLSQMAAAHERLGDVLREVELRERALSIYHGLYSDVSFPSVRAMVADATMQLAEACGRLGDRSRRQELLQQALRMEEDLFGPDSCRVARVLAKLGKGSNPTTAAEQLQRALDTLQAEYSWNHPLVVEVLETLGNVHGELGDVEKQKESLEHALVLKEPLYGLQHPEVAVTLTSLSHACSRLHWDDQSEELALHAAQIIERSCVALLPKASAATCLEQPGPKDQRQQPVARREAEAAVQLARRQAERTLMHQAECVGALAAFDEASRGNPDSPCRQLRLLRKAMDQLQHLFGPHHCCVQRAKAALNVIGTEGTLAEPWWVEKEKEDEKAELSVSLDSPVADLALQAELSFKVDSSAVDPALQGLVVWEPVPP